MTLTQDSKVLREKLVRVPICPPQISHGLAWDETLAFEVIVELQGVISDLIPNKAFEHKDHECDNGRTVLQRVGQFKSSLPLAPAMQVLLRKYYYKKQ
jgi:hypothetical protein